MSLYHHLTISEREKILSFFQKENLCLLLLLN